MAVSVENYFYWYMKKGNGDVTKIHAIVQPETQYN